jgi:hypothetical protein
LGIDPTAHNWRRTVYTNINAHTQGKSYQNPFLNTQYKLLDAVLPHRHLLRHFQLHLLHQYVLVVVRYLLLPPLPPLLLLQQQLFEPLLLLLSFYAPP